MEVVSSDARIVDHREDSLGAEQGSRIWRMLNADIDVDEGLKHQEASCCKMNGGLAISCDNRGHADVRLTGDPHWGENRWGVHPNSARTQLQVERYITNAATKQGLRMELTRFRRNSNCYQRGIMRMVVSSAATNLLTTIKPWRL